jgi:hypothetical protein
MGKRLVIFITCGCESSAPFLVHLAIGHVIFCHGHNLIGLVVSDKKIFKISANENTLWTLADMLDFKSAPKTQIWSRTIQ